MAAALGTAGAEPVQHTCRGQRNPLSLLAPTLTVEPAILCLSVSLSLSLFVSLCLSLSLSVSVSLSL